MEMFCPECQGTLRQEGRIARCTVCHASFDVLFSRMPAQVPVPPPLPVPMPAPDAALPAPDGALRYNCPSCGLTLKIRPHQQGKSGRCHCGAVFTAPVADAVAVDSPPALPAEFADGAAAEAAAAVASLSGSDSLVKPQCYAHPGVDAVYACAACRSFLCSTCAFPQPDGSQLCANCVTAGVPRQVDGMDLGLDVSVPGLPGVTCQTHPGVQAVHYCRKCRAPVCATCDFAFPGDLHLCPRCATTAPTGVSKQRKGRLYWAMGLAIWCTLGTIIFLVAIRSAETAEEATITGTAAWLLAGIPSIVGLGIGLSCFEKNLRNPPILWVAAIWNIVVCAFWLLHVIANMAASQ